MGVVKIEGVSEDFLEKYPAYFTSERLEGYRFSEEKALAWLLEEGPVFAEQEFTNSEPSIEVLNLFVIANDLFGIAVSDQVDLTYGQIETLYKMCKDDPIHGADKWCCIQENTPPIASIKEAMIKDGAWDEVMESLPYNNPGKFL